MFSNSRILWIVMLAIATGLPIRGNAQETARAGAVFVMTNAADKNEIIAYRRNADGSLGQRGRFATGGRGSGGVNDPLGSQGSLTLTTDHSFLLAVNAGSGDVSVFQISPTSLTLTDLAPCGGSEPVAVAQHGSLVYVLNAGGSSNVTAFHIDRSGKLRPIRNSTTFLTTANSGAASLSFSPDGQTLLVTEKLTNNIDGFEVQADGTLGPIVVNPGAGPGTFAVEFAPNGIALAVETGPPGGMNASAISSYSVLPNESLSVVSANVPTLAAATCWLAVTPNGHFVYTSNPGSASISGFAIAGNGVLTALGSTVLVNLPAGSSNLDIAITVDSRFLYSLDSGTGAVSVFSIGQDGLLTTLGEVDGLGASVGMNGIAAI